MFLGYTKHSEEPKFHLDPEFHVRRSIVNAWQNIRRTITRMFAEPLPVHGKLFAEPLPVL